MTSLSQKSINNSLTRANSAEIAGFAMPSDIYEDLTPVANHGLLLQAPANGYVFIYGSMTNGVLAIVTSSADQDTYPTNAADKKILTGIETGSGDRASVVPVLKGDNVWQDSSNFATYVCRFYYAEGEA